MTPQQREAWMKKDHHRRYAASEEKIQADSPHPFSSNTGSLGPTSIETENLQGWGIEQEAAMEFIEDPVWADLKFNWSHPISTTKLVKVHGGKLFGAYFSPNRQHIKSPGLPQRGFFCLRWGVPEFIRDHIKSKFSGYVEVI